MKTQCTIETSDSVRTLIALRLTGELRLASREEVRKYMEAKMFTEVTELENQIMEVANQIGHRDPVKE